MTLASLKVRRVALYSLSAPVDAASQIAVSTYTRVLSPDADGLWWASRGVRSGRETSPTTAAQHVRTFVFGFDSEVPVTADGVIVEDTQVFRITSIMPRDQGRDEVQVETVQIDDADASFNLVEPT